MRPIEEHTLVVLARKGVDMEDIGGRLKVRPQGNLKATGVMN